MSSTTRRILGLLGQQSIDILVPTETLLRSMVAFGAVGTLFLHHPKLLHAGPVLHVFETLVKLETDFCGFS
jgi:hypothetical protein